MRRMNTDAEERFKESWEIISGQKNFENLDKGVKLKKKKIWSFFYQVLQIVYGKDGVDAEKKGKKSLACAIGEVNSAVVHINWIIIPHTLECIFWYTVKNWHIWSKRKVYSSVFYIKYFLLVHRKTERFVNQPSWKIWQSRKWKWTSRKNFSGIGEI